MAVELGGPPLRFGLVRAVGTSTMRTVAVSTPRPRSAQGRGSNLRWRTSSTSEHGTTTPPTAVAAVVATIVAGVVRLLGSSRRQEPAAQAGPVGDARRGRIGLP